jgi:hypothetical protein
MTPTRASFASTGLFIALLTTLLPAQCTNPWLAGQGVPGVDTFVNAVTGWDPDGAGPAPTRIVVGGPFSVAGDSACDRIAAWDPATSTWSPLGSGMDDVVLVLGTMPNGDLVAGGGFTVAGGIPAPGIARWNGTAWSSLGGGLAGGAIAFATLPNGDLVVAGQFTHAGGVPANNIARWDGSAWHALGAGTNDIVRSLCVRPNGDLVAGGYFTSAGGVPTSLIARWDGVAWSALGAGISAGPGLSYPSVLSMATLPNGDLVAGGEFESAGGVPASCIAQWNGTAWSPLGSGVAGPFPFASINVTGLLTLANGDLLAGGRFQFAGGTAASNVARWNGVAWSPIDAGTDADVTAVAPLPGGSVAIGGLFAKANGVTAKGIATWDGVTWSTLGGGTDWPVLALARHPNGDILAGGSFTTIGGAAANHIARWNGSAWSALGTGIGGPPSTTTVRTITTLANGDVIAAGLFDMAGGVPANSIARWNGSTWAPLGLGLTDSGWPAAATCLAALANDHLVVGGSFSEAGGVWCNNIARWDGVGWSSMGGFNNGVQALAVLPNGDVVAGGAFTPAFPVPVIDRIAIWSGSSWSALGTGVNGLVHALAVLPNGQLVAAGDFTSASGVPANRIARWNGASWSALGSGLDDAVYALLVLQNGDLVAGGAFTTAGGSPASRIARWNGVAWSALGSGLTESGWGAVIAANALVTQSSADVVIGGQFLKADSQVSSFLAQMTTSCPAAVANAGAGCPSSGGANSLTTALPWLGAKLRSTAVGLPSQCVVGVVTGFSQTSLPLWLAFPEGGFGCTLHANPDVVDFVLANAGTVVFDLPLPNTMAFAGYVLQHQMVPVEIDQTQTPIAITATNAVEWTIGYF